MAKTGLEVKGLSNVLARIRNYPEAVVSEVDAMIGAEVNEMVNRAVASAPVDDGILKNSISYARLGSLNYIVTASASYAPYIEFGTRRNFRNDYPTLAAYAAQFKGKTTGSAEDFLKSIMGWVKRKGIRFDSAAKFATGKKQGQNKQLTYEQTAYLIYHFILLHGIHPHPFFFKNYFIATQNIIKGIRAAVQKAKQA